MSQSTSVASTSSMMEASSSSSESNLTALTTKIETFVFLDLETTGLYNDPRILEISMLAVSRKDLLKMKHHRSLISQDKDSNTLNSNVKLGPPSPPRILHKFSRLFYPRKLICPIVEDLTGLSNETLEHLPPFSKSTAEIIEKFLDLPPPVCLLAHNGSRFDFPILKAEIDGVKEDILNDILCADTLTWAQNFQKIEIDFLTELAKDFNDEDFMMETPAAKKTKSSDDCLVSNGSQPEPDDCQIESPNTHLQNLSQSVLNTPPKVELSNLIPPTPKKNYQQGNSFFTPQQKSPSIINCEPIRKPGAKRTLIYDSDSKSPKNKSLLAKKPFSQPSIYERIFGIKYNSHQAENDALALMQICGYFGNQFVVWADNNRMLFKDVKPKWKRIRKAFQLP